MIQPAVLRSLILFVTVQSNTCLNRRRRLYSRFVLIGNTNIVCYGRICRNLRIISFFDFLYSCTQLISADLRNGCCTSFREAFFGIQCHGSPVIRCCIERLYGYFRFRLNFCTILGFGGCLSFRAFWLGFRAFRRNYCSCQRFRAFWLGFCAFCLDFYGFCAFCLGFCGFRTVRLSGAAGFFRCRCSIGCRNRYACFRHCEVYEGCVAFIYIAVLNTCAVRICDGNIAEGIPFRRRLGLHIYIRSGRNGAVSVFIRCRCHPLPVLIVIGNIRHQSQIIWCDDDRIISRCGRISGPGLRLAGIGGGRIRRCILRVRFRCCRLLCRRCISGADHNRLRQSSGKGYRSCPIFRCLSEGGLRLIRMDIIYRPADELLSIRCRICNKLKRRPRRKPGMDLI